MTEPAGVDDQMIDPVDDPKPIVVQAVPVSDALADAMVSRLASQIPTLTAADVKAILTSFNDVQEGDPLGTIRKDANGVVAVRIAVEGVHKWHLVNPADGSTWNDNENSVIAAWTAVETGV